MAKWIIGQTNEWMSEWMNLDLLKWNSNETAAMLRKFLPLWQFHKLRHSTINKWRRYNRKCTCIVQKNKADRVRRGEGAERDRVMKASRGNRQAGRQLQRVCQAAKSVANYAIQRGTSSPPHQYSSLLPLLHARKNSSSVLFPHCRGCLRQLRYTKAKSECQKAKSDGPNDMWKYANAKYPKWMNWVESGLRVCLCYGPQACGRSIRGLPVVQCGGGGDWCYRNCTSPSLNIMDQTQDESCQAQHALIMMSKFALIASEKRVGRTSETPYLNIPCKCLNAWCGTLLHYEKLNFACTWK